jgi:AmmeMemoRadiSam system protein A
VQAVAARLAGRPTEPPVPPFERLATVGASFVTLERQGRLRGCIGTIEASRPLYLDVIRNAERAMADPRLPRVTAADWPELDVKVSVLSPMVPVPATDRHAVEGALRPGIDGVLLTDGQRRATFLPSVWAKLPEPAAFLDALLNKGGWAGWAGWPDGLEVRRYRSVEFADRAPRADIP